jgi:hypothetical protein
MKGTTPVRRTRRFDQDVEKEMGHIPHETFVRFVEGRATRGEGRQIITHLLRGCDPCAALALRVYRSPVPGQAYDEVLDRVTRRILATWGTIDLPALRKVSACSPW